VVVVDLVLLVMDELLISRTCSWMGVMALLWRYETGFAFGRDSGKPVGWMSTTSIGEAGGCVRYFAKERWRGEWRRGMRIYNSDCFFFLLVMMQIARVEFELS
jgi:hypothetical protein